MHLHDKRKWKKALREYRGSIKEDPYLAYRNMGRVLTQLKKYDEAIKMFRKAIRHIKEDGYERKLIQKWVGNDIGWTIYARDS